MVWFWIGTHDEYERPIESLWHVLQTATSNASKLLDERMKALTVEGKFDDAVKVQTCIQEISKAYNIIDPTSGANVPATDLPKWVMLTENISMPLIVDGQKVGLASLQAGRFYRLVRVDGQQLNVQLGDSVVSIPVDATDLVKRIQARQAKEVEHLLKDDLVLEAGKEMHLRDVDGEGEASMKLQTVDEGKVPLGSSNLTLAGTFANEEMNTLVASPSFVSEAVADFKQMQLKAVPIHEVEN